MHLQLRPPDSAGQDIAPIANACLRLPGRGRGLATNHFHVCIFGDSSERNRPCIFSWSRAEGGLHSPHRHERLSTRLQLRAPQRRRLRKVHRRGRAENGRAWRQRAGNPGNSRQEAAAGCRRQGEQRALMSRRHCMEQARVGFREPHGPPASPRTRGKSFSAKRFTCAGTLRL